MASKYTIAAADCETDPFLEGRIPVPFAWGFYKENEYYEFWEKKRKHGEPVDPEENNVTEDFLDFLASLEEPHIIYMHNGGNFDFHFLIPYAERNEALKIVNGRVIQMEVAGHVLRDSLKIIPVPLRDFDKGDIEYAKLEANMRHKHRKEISRYLKRDCTSLYKLVTEFRDMFGEALTIGGVAERELKKRHPVINGNETHDATFRDFFFGGRCQVFEAGIIHGNFKVYDVTSMYPAVMRNYMHPTGTEYTVSKELTDSTDFVRVTGRNHGALADFDKKSWRLDFTTEYGTFMTTGHELRAALDTGTFQIETIECAYTFAERLHFADFVNHFFGLRLEASLAMEKNPDDLLAKIHKLFYKLLLNNAYGRFAMNPDEWEEYVITDPNRPPMRDVDMLEWQDWNANKHKIPKGSHERDSWYVHEWTNDYWIWARPAQRRFFQYKNVATGASITGAARSVLLRGLSNAIRPVYCDTDSIICEGMREGNGIVLDEHALGAWKTEATGDRFAAAGKKLYALFNGEECVKKASKGGNLNPDEIVAVAVGDVIHYANPVPNFKLSGDHRFVERNIRRTAWEVKPFAIA